MNVRIIKETRDLLPAFAGTLPLIVVPQLIWPAAGLGYLALGVACLFMAGSSFGMEFQHRTLSLLLSQPIPRSVLWRDKMLVLGVGMLTSLVVLLVCLAVSGPASGRVEWLTLALMPLCAFCGVPFWTLALRQGIAGVVSAVGIPSSILAALALVVGIEKRVKAASVRGQTDLTSLRRTIKSDLLLQAKRHGFSDVQLAHLLGSNESTLRRLREIHEVRPVFLPVDTCAGEFESKTPYFYGAFESEDDALGRGGASTNPISTKIPE